MRVLHPGNNIKCPQVAWTLPSTYQSINGRGRLDYEGRGRKVQEGQRQKYTQGGGLQKLI